MDAVSRWHHSPVLQAEIQAVLREWGAWSRADPHNLRFNSKTPGLQLVSNTRSPVIDVERAELSEWIISSWSTSGSRGRESAFLLKLVHVERKSVGATRLHYNRKFKQNLSADAVRDLIDSAELGFYLLSA